MVPEKLRKCIYTLILQELEKAKTEDIPEVNIPELVSQIKQSDGKILDEILIKKVVEVPKEAGEGANPQTPIEGQDSDIAEGKRRESQRERTATKVIEDERRQPLLNFMKARLKKAGLSKFTVDVLSCALEVSVEEAHSMLEDYGEMREALCTLFEIIMLWYRKVLVVAGQTEVWRVLNETEKTKMMAEIMETILLSKGKMLFLMEGNQHIYKEMDPDFTGRFKIFKPKLRFADHSLDALSNPRVAVDVFLDFLNSDEIRAEKIKEMEERDLDTLYPFTRDGVAKIMELVSDNIVEALLKARELIDSGAKSNFATIDDRFVDSYLSKQS
jgi:hypothetical protein